MSYLPMTPRLEAIPVDRRNLDSTVIYRSPPRPSDTKDRDETVIVEISDDESDTDPPPRFSPPRPSFRRKPPRRASTVSSASDADVSDTEFALEPRLALPARTLKRTWTPGSPLTSSPQIQATETGKRRANLLSSHALTGPHSTDVGHGLPLPERPKRDGTASKPGNAVFSANTARQHYAKSEKKNKKKAAHHPPYYVDGRVGLTMYRGPGYERFPVVLGTVEGQQELCNKWDAEQAFKLEKKAAKLRQAFRAAYIIHDSDSDSGDDETAGDGKTAFEKRCLASVIEVFPDIERAYVEKKIQDAPPQPQYFDEHDQEIIDTGAPPLATRIITEILEMQSYPTQRPTNSMAAGKGAADDGTGITITWDRNLPKDQMYTKDAIILLGKHFVNVPSHYITQVVGQTNSIFDSYVTIQGQEDQYYSLEPRPYTRRVKSKADLEKKYKLLPGDRRIPEEYANRVNELQAAKQFVAREAIKYAVKRAKDEAEALNLAEHVKTGAIVECQCCFDMETPLNRIVPCMADVPHFFCFTCVEGQADNQIGMMRYEMCCMDAGGCTAELSHEDVGKAVPITTFDRLELNKQQAEIMAANIDGLEQCPCCEYKAICLDVVQEPIFLCQNPECSRATCRRCQKDSHAPKSCVENSRDKILSARHLVEEARSEAIIRTCPRCKAKILKDFGCNKMTCARCSCRMCYVCNADITHAPGDSYSHFGGECTLYDKNGINRHEKEANEAEKDAISKAKAMDAELDETKLRIDTGQPSKRSPSSALLNHPAADVFLRDLNNRAGRLNPAQTHLRFLQDRVERLQALRPDRELEDILAGIQRTRVQEGQPPMNPRERLRQLVDLHRRAQLNQERHQPRFDAQPQQLAPAAPGVPAYNQMRAALHPTVNMPILLPPMPTETGGAAFKKSQ
ncbi:hypothetical protein AYL99_08023 [Fonsecaea erecta]|uniref:RING-type domain-containing protein n=1 Tax=Fonsecaea erecta TaxID=1367422 RepID=A0A178ZDZ1_9EURO|nr:hypothetical protein AYL99_08023 [Fonsecaea erecta]OAP57285.1 hypothetical protein AYL99_08023 [Fonsecaea erecta]